MDKNLRAELLVLRNEVLTNLEKIKVTVDKIDIKLNEEEEKSWVARCPNISSLLNYSSQVMWHPDAPEHLKTGLASSVAKVTEYLSVSDTEKSAQAMAWVIDAVRKLDNKMGNMSGRAPSEEYWDRISPGTSERAIEQLYETKIKDGDIRMPANNVDEDEVKKVLDLASKLIKTEEGKTEVVDLNLAPEWAKDVDHKSSIQLLKEAAEWDEDSQILFGRMWNRTAHTRIDLMEQVMAETIDHVRSYNYYNERVTIKNQEEARKLVSRYEDLENAKDRVIGILRNFDRDTIKEILESSRSSVLDDREEYLENWVRYYDWYARLVGELERVATEMPQGSQVASSCLTMLKTSSADREMTVLDPKVVDASTFEYVTMKMPADKLEAFRKKAYADYMRDLERAYAWRNKPAADIAA
jgi:hypothetical protein